MRDGRHASMAPVSVCADVAIVVKAFFGDIALLLAPSELWVDAAGLSC